MGEMIQLLIFSSGYFPFIHPITLFYDLIHKSLILLELNFSALAEIYKDHTIILFVKLKFFLFMMALMKNTNLFSLFQRTMIFIHFNLC